MLGIQDTMHLQLILQGEGSLLLVLLIVVGTYTDAIQVAKYYTPKPQLNADTTLCSGEVLQVTMGLTDLQMQGVFPTWENGSHARARAITKSGKYWVYAENVCGDGSDSAEYTFNSLPHFGF